MNRFFIFSGNRTYTFDRWRQALDVSQCSRHRDGGKELLWVVDYFEIYDSVNIVKVFLA